MAGRHERRKTPRYGVMLMGVILRRLLLLGLQGDILVSDRKAGTKHL